jgi:hypothetical protein
VSSELEQLRAVARAAAAYLQAQASYHELARIAGKATSSPAEGESLHNAWRVSRTRGEELRQALDRLAELTQLASDAKVNEE